MSQPFPELDMLCGAQNGGYACPLLKGHDGNHEWWDNTDEITDSYKLDYLYQVARRADKLMTELEPQIKPFLDGLAKNPMLKMLGLGK